jgi:squalene-associated FAD-dependent desaturase
MKAVAIVGAGLAGLAAALDLKAAGYRVEVFERSRLLGGRATSFEIDGREVDNGQHVFLACCTEFIGFAQRVGLGDRLHLQPRFAARVLDRDGRVGELKAAPLPAPLHLLASFARYAHLSLGGRLRVARGLLAGTFAGKSRGTTFSAWLDEHGQDARTRYAFWDPFFVAALNAPSDKVGVGDAMFTLRTAFLRDADAARFGFSRVPLAHLAQAAAQQLDAVHLQSGVTALDIAAPGAAPRVTLHLVGDRTASFDAVVLAAPPRVVAKLLGDPARYGLATLERYEPYPIVDVHLFHDGGTIGIDFAAALGSPLQWIFEKEPGYLCCSFSAADEYTGLTNAELAQLAWDEVRLYLPVLRSASLRDSAVTRNPEATYLPPPGVPRVPQRTSDPAVAIAGSWTETGWPDTMESAVRSGSAAARALLEVERIVA